VTNPILRATPAHAMAMAAIHGAAFPPGQRWGAQAMALELALPGVFALVDPRGGMILARVAADEAEILTLAVMPEARRHGVARALLEQAAAVAAEEGAVALFLEVALRNVPARALYTAAGFAEVGQRRRYYADGDDAMVMRRPLTPAPANPR
jgi:[ribosomal protein S18]-alanine N-acetyltransferase